MIDLLRAISLGTWLGPLVVLFMPTVRALTHRSTEHEKALMWFVSLLVVGFNLRHLFAPDSTAIYALLYVLSILCALGVFWVSWSDVRR